MSPYDAWKKLASEDQPLRPGDLLETLQPSSGSALQIAKYIGFEPAQWFIPEPKQETAPSSDTPVQASNERAISGNIA